MQLTEKEAYRFWKHVTKHECGCWFWRVRDVEYYYGVFSLRGKSMGAHVVSFLLHGGTLSPEKPWVLHSCNRRACVNPDHLRAGDCKDNADDVRKKTKVRAQWRECSDEIVRNLKAVVSDVCLELELRHLSKNDQPAYPLREELHEFVSAGWNL